jgi:hypothetical protein
LIMSNSLTAMRLELVREWSDKNLPLTPDMINGKSCKNVWWKCSLGHSWKAKIYERTVEEKDCQVCEQEYRSVFSQLAAYLH